MKLFNYEEVKPKQVKYQNIQNQAVKMIIQICKSLEISLPAMHAALWVFHCNAIIMTYHKFDRFMYACGAVLVGSKLMECLRYPVQIIANCRKILRKRKNLQADEDSEDYLRKQVKKVFEAEVNIMINIGFDFDIKVALQVQGNLRITQQCLIQNFPVKFKQALTSLYSSQVVVFFDPQIIACLALKIILRAESRNIKVMGFDQKLTNMLLSEQVRIAQKEYFERCDVRDQQSYM